MNSVSGTAVLGYNPQGELVKLREGKNELICLASDPAKTDIPALPATTGTWTRTWLAAVSSWLRKSLGQVQPTRLSSLERSGGRKTRHAARRLDAAIVLHRLWLRLRSGKVTDAYLRWVIYVPFATPDPHRTLTQAERQRPVADVS